MKTQDDQLLDQAPAEYTDWEKRVWRRGFLAAMPAPAAEHGDKPVVHVGTIGHVDHGKTTLTTALMKVGAMQRNTQPESRGVEGMVPAVSPNGSDADMLAYLDKLLAVQGQLMFARENYDEQQGEAFGVAILDFMRLYGMRLRAALAADPVPVQEADRLRWALAEYPKRNTQQLQAAKVCAGVLALAGGKVGA